MNLEILLDRYAAKSMVGELFPGDKVVAYPNGKMIWGVVSAVDNGIVSVKHPTTLQVTLVQRRLVQKLLEETFGEVVFRVAYGLAKTVEEAKAFQEVMIQHKFLPGGRILHSAGLKTERTLLNCFALPYPPDSRRGIYETLAVLGDTLSSGGGVGVNMSTLRPKHAPVRGVGGKSSGVVSWAGLYSYATGLTEQGGCLTPDTLVFTEDGLLRLDEIVTHSGQGWVPTDFSVLTDRGARKSNQVYNNGPAEVLRVDTDAGLVLTGTVHHKVKVMTPEGEQWKELSSLSNGDALIVKLGQHQGKVQKLKEAPVVHHAQNPIQFPKELTENMAFFLGYMTGNGFDAKNDWRQGVTIPHKSYLREEMPTFLVSLFPGLTVREQQKTDDLSVTLILSNRHLKECLELNGLIKQGSTEACVPKLIRQSPPSVVGAYLRGLFEADGALCHGFPMLSSTSERLIREVATLLIGLGCPITLHRCQSGKGHFGTAPVWQLKVTSYVGLNKWKELIGCDPRSRFVACMEHQPDLNREHAYALPSPSYWLGSSFDNAGVPLRKRLSTYLRGKHALTASGHLDLASRYSDKMANMPPLEDRWFVLVTDVTNVGVSPTLDIEVEDTHSYLANGIVTHNSRRGALIVILEDWHPSLLEFIQVKRQEGLLPYANISVGISDEFMQAVQFDQMWELKFPDTSFHCYNQEWDGNIYAWEAKGYPVEVYDRVPAKMLWNELIKSNHMGGDPGVLFFGTAKKMSNTSYYQRLSTCNPCGEVLLPEYGCCDLGSLMLPSFITPEGLVDVPSLQKAVRTAVRLLDNVLDVSAWPDEHFHERAELDRRIGIGVMGLGEALIRSKIRYGSEDSLEWVDNIMRIIAEEAYMASVALAEERGSFPMFDREKFVESGYMQGMTDTIRNAIYHKGIRNCALLTAPPTGTLGSMMNTSTGIEPFFSFAFKNRTGLGTLEHRFAFDPGPYRVSAHDLTPEEHITVAATVQRWVDNSVSKTVNLPEGATEEDVGKALAFMYRCGMKGGTIYRDNSKKVQALVRCPECDDGLCEIKRG